MNVLKSISPTAPTDVIVSFAETEAAEVMGVYEKARPAQKAWWEMGAPARAAALSNSADALQEAFAELVALMVREVGKPYAEATGEVVRAVSILRYYAQAAFDPDGASLPPAVGRGILFTKRRAHGVAGLVTPWNFPLAIPLWKAAPALAFGNAVVLKPAPAATAVALRLGEILAHHLPPDLFSVVLGDRQTGEAVVANADVVSFTGSTNVGRAVALQAVQGNIPAQAEMGGQNPSLVLPDADFEAAARMIASAAMGFAGQKCTATSRVILVGEAGQFVDALVSEIRALTMGDPAEPATVVGPVISQGAAEAVSRARAEAEAAGGRVIASHDSMPEQGFFAAPVIVDGIAPSHRLAQVETFGPFAVILRAGDEQEAVRIANDVRYGLVTSVFTASLDSALRIGEQIDAGLLRFNAPTSGVDFHAPFGGAKESSFGPREQGKAAQDFYTWTQTVTVLPTHGA